MTSTTAIAPDTDRTMLPVAALTFLGTSAFTALGLFGDGTDGAEHDPVEFFVITGVTAVAIAIVFGLVVRRVQHGSRAAGVGLGLAVAGLVLVVLAFWSGLTPPLAVGGMLLGGAARRTGRRPTLGAVAIALGALALVGYVAIYALDWMSTNNIAGL
jgi:hypothetical protein